MMSSMRFHFAFDNYFKMVRLAWNEKSLRARVYYLVVLCLGVPITAAFHAEHPRVSPEERCEAIRIRQRHVQKRYRVF
jgi:hypothetical protein